MDKIDIKALLLDASKIQEDIEKTKSKISELNSHLEMCELKIGVYIEKLKSIPYK